LRNTIAGRSGWGAVLLLSVFTTVFAVAIAPIRFHNFLYSVLFSIMFIAAGLSLEKRNILILGLAFGVAVIEWISAHLLTNEVAILTRISRALSIFFFALIVIRLIAQIAGRARVDGRVILAAINGGIYSLERCSL
jgi:ABC-type uncharacterized transport system permease subunit